MLLGNHELRQREGAVERNFHERLDLGKVHLSYDSSLSISLALSFSLPPHQCKIVQSVLLKQSRTLNTERNPQSYRRIPLVKTDYGGVHI